MPVSSKPLTKPAAATAGAEPRAWSLPSVSFSRTLWAWRSIWALGCGFTFLAFAPRMHWVVALLIAVPLQLLLSELERVMWQDRTIYDEDGAPVVNPETGRVEKERVSVIAWALAIFALGVDTLLNLTGTAPVVANLHRFPPLEIAYAFFPCDVGGTAARELCRPPEIQGSPALAVCIMLGVAVAAAAEILREQALRGSVTVEEV